MGGKKEYLKSLENNGNERLRVKLTIEKSKVIDLVFQYESLIHGRWCEIVRYDSSHGFFHRDFISPDGKKEKTRIEIPEMKSAATYAEQDIKDKWEFYKSKYLKKYNRKKK